LYNYWKRFWWPSLRLTALARNPGLVAGYVIFSTVVCKFSAEDNKQLYNGSYGHKWHTATGGHSRIILLYKLLPNSLALPPKALVLLCLALYPVAF